jgi:uncharacterized metal-binding protein YceD (DUF177 family)
MTTLAWTHFVRDVPASGLDVTRTATGEEAKTLASELEIEAIDKLTVTYRIMPALKARLAMKGILQATVTQNCVVTLEPVISKVSVPLDIVFSSDKIAALPEDEIGLDDLDRPDEEPIENGQIDIGRIVVEELMSGLDPYPRREDANFDWTDEKAAAAATNPFAALSRLKSSGDDA